MSWQEELAIRAQDYAAQHGLTLGSPLGFGVHGAVFATAGPLESNATAVKAFKYEKHYCRERDVYLRLQRKNVTMIRGCNVPQLIAYDDLLLVIEMTVVKRPFVLDFAGAYLDKGPDFSEEVMADWEARRSEEFGKRWPEVLQIKAILEIHGIYMEDIHLGNISFADSPKSSSSPT